MFYNYTSSQGRRLKYSDNTYYVHASLCMCVIHHDTHGHAIPSPSLPPSLSSSPFSLPPSLPLLPPSLPPPSLLSFSPLSLPLPPYLPPPSPFLSPQLTEGSLAYSHNSFSTSLQLHTTVNDGLWHSIKITTGTDMTEVRMHSLAISVPTH